MSNDNLELAREWAEHHAHTELVLDAAAAEVITALPDTIVDGDKLREVINAQLESHPHGTAGHQVAEELARKLQDLIPAPTLADMTPDEREACQWMQADTHGIDGGVIQRIHEEEGQASILTVDGVRMLRRFGHVTPLPGLPKLEWPGQEARTEPRPEDVPEGECAMEEQMSEVERGYIVHDDVERTNLPERTIVRRFVTDWEEA